MLLYQKEDKMRDQSKEKKRREALYEKFGHLINIEDKDKIPPEHKAKFNGGLRCFGRVPIRDKKTGMKIKVDGKIRKRRCKNVAIKGSLFCRKCGGGNTAALVHGRDATLNIYRGAYPNKFGDILDAFMSDPSITDLRPELAHVRAIMRQYVAKLINAKPKSSKKFIRSVQYILDSPSTTNEEKFLAVKELVEEQTSITDGRSIDRINRTIDTVGKTIERIHKIQSKDNFTLTPDGLKVLLRAVIEVIQECVPDKDVQAKIREKFMGFSTMTAGDISKLKTDQEEAVDVEFTMKEDKFDEFQEYN